MLRRELIRKITANLKNSLSGEKRIRCNKHRITIFSNLICINSNQNPLLLRGWCSIINFLVIKLYDFFRKHASWLKINYSRFGIRHGLTILDIMKSVYGEK